jgi:hypothetical protein
MMRRILLLSSAAMLAAFGQKYDGPRPPKPDLPYIKHADHLVATEAVTSKAEKKNIETVYTMEGASSSARTPLPLPVFLVLADKLMPERFGLYRLEVKDGHREVSFTANKEPQAIRIEVKRLDGKLYWIEVGDSLDPGEYALSPEGTNQAFCFQVF